MRPMRPKLLFTDDSRNARTRGGDGSSPLLMLNQPWFLFLPTILQRRTRDRLHGTPDLSGSASSHTGRCRINPAFRVVYPAFSSVLLGGCAHSPTVDVVGS